MNNIEAPTIIPVCFNASVKGPSADKVHVIEKAQRFAEFVVGKGEFPSMEAKDFFCYNFGIARFVLVCSNNRCTTSVEFHLLNLAVLEGKDPYNAGQAKWQAHEVWYWKGEPEDKPDAMDSALCQYSPFEMPEDLPMPLDPSFKPKARLVLLGSKHKLQFQVLPWGQETKAPELDCKQLTERQVFSCISQNKKQIYPA